MFRDLTLDYRGVLNQEHIPITTIKVQNDLRTKLIETGRQISTLKLMLDRQCLPSFTQRRKRMIEINKQKCVINGSIHRCNGIVKDINGLNICDTMKKSMRRYFATKVEQILLEYRNIEERFLEKMNRMKIFDELEESKVAVEYCDVSLAKKKNEVEQIRKSIFYLTTLLLEMKMIVGSQTWKIDRVEFFVGMVNENLKGSNKELEEIPKRHNRIKNRIIYFLSITVVILTIFSLLKALKQRNKF
jgi:hypothetical protein